MVGLKIMVYNKNNKYLKMK